ncbi:uncharacterized protein LOC142320219 [Lycorma delicatula]|uniref:uncharacterized protein LOC142320219 n=1 Tax=Lycorma delicatula TaxID=130591 RepID=UPI003F514788
MPKGKFVAQNILQVEFMHYPKQQQCILVDLLEQMEYNKLPPGYIPCYKLVELLHTKASELENNCKCMGKSDCSNVETIHCRIEDEADEYCYDDSKAESSYDPCNPCSTKDFESSFLSKTDCPSEESSQHSQSCHKDTCFSNKQSSRSGSIHLGTPPKEQDKMLGQGYGHLFSDDCTSQNSSNKSDKLKEVCSLKDEIKRLKCLVEKQCHTECELEIATKTVCQLRNEIDTLQDCLSKQKKEISEMIKICDQQQVPEIIWKIIHILQ